MPGCGCIGCRIVSQVTSLHRNGQPWDYIWCHTPNGGFAAKNDLATATIGDLGADMAKHGLALTPKASAQAAEPKDTQPMLIGGLGLAFPSSPGLSAFPHRS